jgi:hypothetical protein
MVLSEDAINAMTNLSAVNNEYELKFDLETHLLRVLVPKQILDFLSKSIVLFIIILEHIT